MRYVFITAIHLYLIMGITTMERAGDLKVVCFGLLAWSLFITLRKKGGK